MKVSNFIKVLTGLKTVYINPDEISHIIQSKSINGSKFIISMKNGENIEADEGLFVQEIDEYEQTLENSEKP